MEEHFHLTDHRKPKTVKRRSRNKLTLAKTQDMNSSKTIDSLLKL